MDRLYPPTWLTLALSAVHVIALGDMPYGYYQFLRLVVTGYAGYITYIHFKNKKNTLAWTFTFMALLYNPVFVIGMERATHAIFNCLSALLIIIEWRFGRKPKSDEAKSLLPARDALGGELLTPAMKHEEHAAQLATDPNLRLTRVRKREEIRETAKIVAISAAVVFILAFAVTAYKESSITPEEANTEPYVLEQFEEPNSGLNSHQNSLTEPAPVTADTKAIPTLGEFVDTITNAVKIGDEIYRAEGLSGMKAYSKKCTAAAASSVNILDTDFCVAFDMFAITLDQVATANMPYGRDEYFLQQEQNFSLLYDRYSATHPPRIDHIRNEVLSLWQEI